MTRRHTPSALRRLPTPEEDDEQQSAERPTINPPFDVAAFARASENKLRTVGGEQGSVPAPAGGEEGDATGVGESPEISGHTIEDPAREMRERFALGDWTGALDLAELILTAEPDNLEAAECGEDCRTRLETLIASRFGSLDRVPMIMVPPSQLRWLSMDHRAGFVLSIIDGVSSVEMILDVCGMPKLDALRILDWLLEQKIIALR